MGIVFKGISHAIGYRYGVGSGAFYDGLTIPLMYAFLIGQVIILLIVVLIGYGCYRFRNVAGRKPDGYKAGFKL